jgi:hypothetical protein
LAAGFTVFWVAGAFLAEAVEATGFERGREADFEALAMMSVRVQETGCRLHHAFMLQCKRGQPAFTATLRRRRGQYGERLFQNAKAKDADDDQVDRNDEIQQPRHDENENPCDERNDGLKIGDADGHGLISHTFIC